MTLAMEALYRRLQREERYPLLPREITQNLLQKVEADALLDEEQRVELSLVSHFGYGVAIPLHTPTSRTSFGLRQRLRGGDLGSELFQLDSGAANPPAAPPSASQSSRLMIPVHLVLGAGTVWIGECLANRRDASLDNG